MDWSFLLRKRYLTLTEAINVLLELEGQLTGGPLDLERKYYAEERLRRAIREGQLPYTDEFKGRIANESDPFSGWRIKPSDLKAWYETSPPGTVTNNDPLSVSDATLGRHTREQLQRFADKNKESSDARHAEWQRWQEEATNIRLSLKRKLSISELAPRVKKSLNLPDSTETIRKRIK